VDGVFSASIVLMRYPQAKIFFTSYGRENFERISELIYREIIEKAGHGLLVFCDLGLNKEILPLMFEVFEFVRSNNWSILWLDHHPWTDQALELFGEDIVEDRKLILDTSGDKCASELVYEFFLKGNIIAKDLAVIAHTSDFLIKEQFLPPLSELIVYYKTFPNFYPRLTNLSLKISKGTLWDTEMQDEYRIFSNLRDESKTESWKKLRELNLENGIRMMVIPAGPYIQTSLFSEEIFQKTNADIIFFLTKDGKVSIRRSNPILKCNDIAAELLEGGGHKYAAGGRVRSDPLDMNLVIIELKNAVENSLKK
jgi:oligoribonuclease NrnB/cAMP/cGMP phosphodiesterase (DHH superfamily)